MPKDKRENRIKLKETLYFMIQDHAQQGKIPPERELAEMLNVNRSTLRLCLEDLIREGKLYRKPRKGTFIQEMDRKVVGIVVDVGKSHPYASVLNVLSGIFAELEKHGCIVRFLNPRNLEELPELILQYCVDCCIIAHQAQPEADLIQPLIPEKMRHKIIFICCNAYGMSEQSVKYNYVEMASSGRKRIQHILQKSGRKVCVMSRTDKRIFEEVTDELKKQGCPLKKEWIIDDGKRAKRLLSRLIRKKEIDSIYCDGFYPGIYDVLFETLQENPDFTGPVSISYAGWVHNTVCKYPDIKAKIFYSLYVTPELGVETAKMALRVMESGQMQSPVFVESPLTDEIESVIY